VLLGRIIEIATGQDYYDYMQKNVFAPAGATSASFPLLPKNGVAVVPMAYPYEMAWDATTFDCIAKASSGSTADAAVLRAAQSSRHSISSSSPVRCAPGGS
jgi:CubicO group peptidase (beta-lactamase class C family)